MIEELQRRTLPLETSDALDALMERIGDRRVVMLGEASHGTSEFYTWRARISQRLIQEKGFSFIAVEGDWPACYELNRFVRGDAETPHDALNAARRFERWPTWMWANWESVALLTWMRDVNAGRSSQDQVGFFGLDVYSLAESIGAIMAYLEHHAPEAMDAARRAAACFEPHNFLGQDYARATMMVGASCEDEVVALLASLRGEMPEVSFDQGARFSALQNARVVVNAERYYRTMIHGGPQSWNVRDRHMDQTLADLLDVHGPDAKAIVWAHNTHIGDARYTDMARGGMVNLGQLWRERVGDEEVVLVGFGTHRGHVIAGDSWGARMQSMQVPPAIAGSWEDVFCRTQKGDQLLIMDEVKEVEAFHNARPHRAIGVVYHPRREAYGNYVPTVLPRRYDAFVYLDRTESLHPLHVAPDRLLEPEMYPWGV